MALIPIVAIGLIVLLVLGKISLPKSAAEKEREDEVDKKGFAGVTIDDVAGAGASKALQEDITEKGIAGYALDGLVGDGAYKKLTTEIDEIEATRQRAVDGFVQGIEGAGQYVTTTVDNIHAGARSFVASLYRTGEDAQEALFGPGGLFATPEVEGRAA